MTIHKFEEIIAWQKAQDYAVEIYQFFGGSNDFGFRNQICRAAVSISNNIAEGFDRSSKADFRRFLYIALASNSETKSMLYLAKKLNYVKEKDKISLVENSSEIARLIQGLINSLTKMINKEKMLS